VKEEPVILLDAGAKDVGLADMVFHLIRQNLEQKPHRLSSFQGLNSNVAIIARDIDITVTLMFEKGKLTIYNGLLGKTNLKIIADHDVILGLCLLNICMGLPNYFDRNGRDILKKLLLGKLKIEGLFKHPLQLAHVTKLFSVN
jgi:hypothetical protein